MTATTPYPPTIDGADLADELCEVIRSHVVVSEVEIPLVALWIMFTWVSHGSYFQPRLAITSPEPGCGKTTMLRLLELLVSKPMSAANITPAALFRTIAEQRPTVLIDEADTFIEGNEALRGILNAGFEKTGTVTRCVGADFQPYSFPVAAPLAIAAIGDLPATIVDRAINIPMRRKEQGRKIASLRVDKPSKAITDLRDKLGKWTAEVFSQFETHDPTDMPELSSDRAADKFRPLISIADILGDHWPTKARDAVKRFDQSSHKRPHSPGTQLLADIHRLGFRTSEDRLPTTELLGRLIEDEEGPWKEYDSRGRPINAHQLAKLLRPYGIASQTIRFSTGVAKGYHRSDFKEAFERYLPPVAPAP